MAIEAGDLHLYGSQNRPEDDLSTSGGGIDTDARPLEQQPASDVSIAFVSDDAGDTSQVITIQYTRASDGVRGVTEQVTLNGTTEVVMTDTVEGGSIEKITLDTVTSGNVDVLDGSGGSILHTITPGETAAFAMFIGASSSGTASQRYEKLCVRNENGSLTLQNAEVTLTGDPQDKYRIGLESAVNGTDSVTDRTTAPSGVTFQDDDVSLTVPGGNLESGDFIGVWVELDLEADDAAQFGVTHTIQLSGETVA